ncbi:MAG: type II toxin-antitoxin system RelE/ParE family toxin [Thermodesulfobacteriota bacterium]
MPRLVVIFFREDDGTAPMAAWLKSLDMKTQNKCVIRLEMLRDLGNEWRRPYADYLRDGIYELRVKVGTVNYRMLYFFHGSTAVVLSHGFPKEDRVPAKEIDKAVERRSRFVRNPEIYTTLWEHS